MHGHGGWRDGRRTALDLERACETHRATLRASPNDNLRVLERATGELLAERRAFACNDTSRVDLKTRRPSHNIEKMQFTRALPASVVEPSAR